MALPDGYIAALEQLGTAFQTYYQRTGHHAVLVGGAATAIYTAGAFPSGDCHSRAMAWRPAASSEARVGPRRCVAFTKALFDLTVGGRRKP